MAKVAIVIVCMNNLKNLIPCLDSIKKYTKVEYEVWVTAYLFSKENLSLVKEKYPEVHWVESNEIRGFAENNNLALRQVKTEYTLILNDDTEFKEPVLDELLASMEKTPEASIMSPKLLFGNGKLQYCGRPVWTWEKYIKSDIFCFRQNKKQTKYTNKKGIFQTYNISGACFLITTELFRELGFFNESYFFCPEDIALSTLANEKGYRCYVDSSIILYHFQGKTSSNIKEATLPAQRKGSIIYFGRTSKLTYYCLAIYVFLLSLIKSLLLWQIDPINANAQWNCAKSIFSHKTPKEIFIKYYLQIKLKK